MNRERGDGSIDRREFLARSAKAGLSVAAAGALGWWLERRAAPPLASLSSLVSTTPVIPMVSSKPLAVFTAS